MLGGETTAAPNEKSREMRICGVNMSGCGYGVYMVWEQGLRLGSACRDSSRVKEWFTNALDDHLAALVGLPVPVLLAVILKL